MDKLLSFLILFVLLAIVFHLNEIVGAVVFGFVAAFLMWYSTRLNNNGLIMEQRIGDTDGSSYIKSHDDVGTSIIAGPVENYQDNTWEEQNMLVTPTTIPNGLDIQGLQAEIVGYEP